MNTKFYDRYGDRISEAEFYRIVGDGYEMLKIVGGAEDDYPNLSAIQVESLRIADNSDMTICAELEIDGMAPADPSQFRCGWAWPMPRPEEIHLVPFEIVDGRCVAMLTMGGKKWAYDPRADGHQGPGIIWVSSPDDRILTSEQVRGVGWFVETNHEHADVVFAGFSDEPPPPYDPPDPPIDPPPPGDLGPALILLFSSSELLVQAEVLREGADDLTEQARQQLAEATGLLVELAGG